MSARVSRVMMFFFLVLFCGKGHGPLVLSMLVRTGGKKALCASFPPPPSPHSLMSKVFVSVGFTASLSPSQPNATLR